MPEQPEKFESWATTSTARSDAPAPRDAAGETVERLREYADREQRVLDGWHALGATPKSTTLHTERITLARDAAAEIAALRARVEAAEDRGNTACLAWQARCEAAERALREIADTRITHASVSGPSLREQVTLYQSAWTETLQIARAALAAARATPAQDTPTTEG